MLNGTHFCFRPENAINYSHPIAIDLTNNLKQAQVSSNEMGSCYRRN